ncbi:nucleoside hydrolase [Haloarcula sp. CBA1130]|uniref:nucleoside hydrolase n=1 Tax=unclassified Haloarcula TaxID=2624677 RepID=UPI0012488297|nr:MULTISPECIES: nucleoside hydrolase [unclassified Haloarcula]KAA9399169.1 nucleoside hydrolase [Haloarcula sp. CBA1129]KAA9403682.1 nucleoside hydrolase [Haloarcula sp. CBA1130]
MSRKVFFDTDPGCDDAVMLAMALGHDAIDVVGLSTVCGNTTIENTTRNTHAILGLGGYDVPVARGCGRPLVDDLTTAEWIHGENGLHGDIPDVDGDTRKIHGADAIVEAAHEYGEELTIAAVGPLPNLAIALAKEPRLPDLVDDIYLMGGAAMTTGNVTPMAEANFHNDPAAASRVLQDANTRMVGLDVTNRATVSPEFIEAFRTAGGVRGTIAEWLDYRPDSGTYPTADAPAIHDAAVVADIIDESVLTFEEYYLDVDTTGGPCHGAVICDEHGTTGNDPNNRVAVDIDVTRYREILETGIEAYAAE